MDDKIYMTNTNLYRRASALQHDGEISAMRIMLCRKTTFEIHQKRPVHFVGSDQSDEVVEAYGSDEVKG